MSGTLEKRSIIVTGGSTGIGHAACKVLLDRGFQVFGSVRKQEDGGLALIGAILGLLIGLFECARRDAPESDRCDDLPHRPRPSGGVQSVE